MSVPERVLARGVVGGLTSVAQGGKFGQGFFSSAFTKFSTIQLDEHGFFHMEKKDFDAVMGRTAVAAMIGGTASEIGGGKFANGARTAAIAHLYNAEGFGRKKYNTYLAREEKFVRLIEEPLVINRVGVVDFIYMFRSFVLWLCGIDF